MSYQNEKNISSKGNISESISGIMDIREQRFPSRQYEHNEYVRQLGRMRRACGRCAMKNTCQNSVDFLYEHARVNTNNTAEEFIDAVREPENENKPCLDLWKEIDNTNKDQIRLEEEKRQEKFEEERRKKSEEDLEKIQNNLKALLEEKKYEKYKNSRIVSSADAFARWQNEND